MQGKSATETPKKILVTGGLGFIGSHFVELALSRGYSVINMDKRTYAARKDLEFEKNPNYAFLKKDISEITSLPPSIDFIVNFAAESHVENSLHDNLPFFKSNVQGVYNLLELIRKTDRSKRPTLIHASTDEVYGDIAEGSFKENDRLAPSNPYSATKAAADQLIIGWWRSHNIPARICRSCNNYGYGQIGTKLIPNTMKRAHKNLPAQVHGSGTYKREWIWAMDNCEAILLVLEKGKDREIYNISSDEEYTNLQVISKVLKVMGKSDNFTEYVPDRPEQDIRYSIDDNKIRSMGWKPTMTLDRYLPICKDLNDLRRKNLPPGRKRRLLMALGLDKIIRV
ncbi:MAG: GDP-mannose 4,6-dehydratase [Patescibacteria group bacterium]